MTSKDAPDDLWSLYLNSDDDEVRYFAFEELVEHYQYLVEALARSIKAKLPTFIEDEELISRGQIGLLKAMAKYDPEIGKFSSFASSVIWGAIHDGFRANDFAPRGLRKQQRDMEAVKRDLRSEGIDPTRKAIGERMGLSEEDVEEIEYKLVRSEIVPTDPVLLPAYRHEATAGANLWSREMCREFVVWLQQWDNLTQEIVLLRHWKGISLKAISEVLDTPPSVVKEKYRSVLTKVLPFMVDLAE